MTKATGSDNWLIRRIMKLTPFEKWHINSPKHARHTERTALTLFEHVQLPPEPRCLEIGCGQGELVRLLVECYDAQVVASDYDPAQVALARKRLTDLDGQIEFRIVDARAIPFDDAEFDALFSFGVLHHIPSGWREAVTEIARVLKPGGWFVFTDLVLAPRASHLAKRLLPRLDQLGEKALHASLAQNDLILKHYAYDRDKLKIIQGLMNYCTAIVCKA